MNIAVILAGGKGSRLEKSLPKQFFKIAGKMVLEHAVAAFEKNEWIDEIAVVVNEHYIFMVEDMIIKNEWKKVKRILVGGKERYHSSYAAVTAYADFQDSNILFHDAARPLVSQRIITEVVKKLDSYTAVDVAISSADTIIEVEDSIIKIIPDRSKLRRGQTPQGFKQKVIAQAYKLALLDENFAATDDCGIVKKYVPSEKIIVVEGEEANMKLTNPEDTYILDKLFQLQSGALQNIELTKENLANKVLVIFGGNSGIGKCIADLGIEYGAKVHCFSRSQNNVDIADFDAVQKALKAVSAQEGNIDYLINAAGILHKEPLASMKHQAIAESVNTNYLGMINIAQAALPFLKKSKGHLLFFTSSSYTRGRAFFSIYSSAKAATVNFVQAISQEWESFGVKVNCINPERTKTPMRVKNFGNEDESSLLNPELVAMRSLQTVVSDYTGQVVDVRL